MKKLLIAVLFLGILTGSGFALSNAMTGSPFFRPWNVSKEENDDVEYDTYDLLDKTWVDDNLQSTDVNDPYSGLASYTVTQSAGLLEVIPHKYHQSDSLSIDLSDVDLSMYNTLVFQGSGDAVLRLEVTAHNYIAGTKNTIEYPLTIIEDTFMFRLDYENYDLFRETIETITLVFGADVVEDETDLNQTPSVHSPIGTAQISRFEFTTEEAPEALTYNEQGTVIEVDDTTPVEPYDALPDFQVNEVGTYTLSYVDDVLQLATTATKGTWSYVYHNLEGNFQQYTEIVIQVQGDAGAKMKMKLEGPSITNYETGSTANGNIEDITFNGDVQTFTWSIPLDSLSDGEAFMLLLFVEPGEVGTGVELEILLLEFR